MKFLRIRILIRAIVLLILLNSAVSLPAFATSADLRRLFHNTFYSSLYEARRCGKNVFSFIDLARQHSIPIESATIVRIENKGYKNFGLVRGWQAREGGARIRAASHDSAGGRLQFHPGSRNWEFHVFLVQDGLVFDFDFSNHPVVLPLRTYVMAMFGSVGQASHQDRYSMPAPPLDEYRVSLTPAKAYLDQTCPNDSCVHHLKLVSYLDQTAPE